MSESIDEYGEWRDVPGFAQGHVKVSSLGWVMTRSKGGKIRSLGKPKLGYLTKNGRRRVHIGSSMHLVHALVMMAFPKEKPPSADTIDHIDQNPQNNNIENLRWATRETQRRNQGVRKRNRTSKAVMMTNDSGEEYTFDSVRDAALNLGIDRRNISQASTKGCKVGGWNVVYIEPESQENIHGEDWQVCGLDDRLSISTMGRIQRKNDNGDGWGYRYTPMPAKNQVYTRIRLRCGSKMLHKLIKVQFHGTDSDPTKCEISHVNGLAEDNRLCNLKWVSRESVLENRSMCMPAVRE